MKRFNAKDVLKLMISVLLEYLEDLKKYQGKEGEEFQYGERVAYTECLEYIQLWEKAEENGLNFDIENRYPL